MNRQPLLLRGLRAAWVIGIALVALALLPRPVRAETLLIDQDIDSNTTWSSDNIYVVVTDVRILEGVTLHIDPGTIIKLQRQSRLIVEGTLRAQGTGESPIVFTSHKDDAHGGDTNGDGDASAPAANDWGWIEFADSSVDEQCLLEHCSILYGGRDYWSNASRNYGAIRLISASPTIANCTLRHNGNYAIGIDTGSFPAMSGNSFSDNGLNGIGVYGGTISGEGLWSSTDGAYVLDQDITVAGSGSLTISPGVAVKGKSNARLIVDGVLDARGTLASPIVFTSLRDDAHGGDTNGDGAASMPASNDWGWVEFGDGSADDRCILEHCIVQYGGKGYWNYTAQHHGAVRLISASPTISQCAFAHNGNAAIEMDVDSFPEVTDSTFTDNGSNGIRVGVGTISAAGVWDSRSCPYYLDGGLTLAEGGALTISAGVRVALGGDLTVAEGGSLSILPGAVVKSKSNVRLIVRGVLDARGTSGSPIVFTSYEDDFHGGDTNGDSNSTIPAANDWGWIEFADSSLDDPCILEYCSILYGGKSYWDYTTHYYGAVRLISASPTIAHSAFRHNGNYAIGMDAASFPTVTGNSFSDNGTNGIGIYGGTISADSVWDSTNCPYVMDQEITVARGASLTVAPGVVVKSKPNVRLVVNGVLDARGTPGTPIVFTSFKDDAHGGDTNGDGSASTPAGDDWAWIEFADTSLDDLSILEHCTIRYGGRGYWAYTRQNYGAVRLVGASPTISQCVFAHNGNYAIGMDTGSFPTVNGNSFSSNGVNGIGVYEGTISTDGAWSSGDCAYVLDKDVTVAAGASLTISPGVVLKAKPGTRLIVNGVLDARGTATSPIAFTSLKDDGHGGDTNGDGAASAPAANDWGWIEFGEDSADDRCIMEHCTIQYGGKGYWNYSTHYHGAVRLLKASPTLSQCAFAHNGKAAIEMDTDSFPTVIGGNFTDNGTNGIVVGEGTIGSDGTWGSSGCAYVMDGDVTIGGTASLTIAAGVVVKGKEGTRLIVGGALDARGTPGSPIVFTSYRDDDHGGDTNNDGRGSTPAVKDWGWIEFADSSVDGQCILEFCTIKYGGKGYWSYTRYYYGGVRLIDASPTIRHNHITENGHGIWVSGASFPTITGNDIWENEGYGLYNEDRLSVVIAEHNWWGDESGPYDPSNDPADPAQLYNPAGQGDRVTDYVDYEPWRRSAMGQPFIRVDGKVFLPGQSGELRVTVPNGKSLFLSVPLTCEPTAVSATLGGNTVDLSDDDRDGAWTGVITAVTQSPQTLPLTVKAVGGACSGTDQPVAQVTVIQPNGYVYDALSSIPIPDATVTLYRYDDRQRTYVLWDALSHFQANPQLTTVEGRFGWELPEGMYYITVHKLRYQGHQSLPFTVPPQATDLDVALELSADQYFAYLPIVLR